MRTIVSLLLVGCASLAIATGPRVTAEKAAAHRGELVTLVGPVTEVQRRTEGMVLMVGDDPSVPVLVPQAALGRFPGDLAELHQKTIEATGFLTAADRPLALVLDRPNNLHTRTGTATAAKQEDVHSLRQRVRTLESEVAYLRAQTQPQPLQLITYGPGRKVEPIQPYAMQATVLAERGIPDRVEWTSRGRTLVYGQTRYHFDPQGQLISVGPR